MELTGQVAGRRGAGPAAEHHHPGPDGGQRRHRLVDVAMGQQAQGRLQVVRRDLQRAAENRVCPGALRLVAITGEGRAQPRLHLVAEALLELRVASEAELGDEPRDCWRADARSLGEPRHALQAGDRVRREQSPRQPALRPAQAVQALPDDLADPGVSFRDVCYILPQSSAPGTSLTTVPAPDSFAAKPRGEGYYGGAPY